MRTCKKFFSAVVCSCILLVFTLCIADYIDEIIPILYTITVDTDEVEATFTSSWDGSKDYPFEGDTEGEASGSEETEDVSIADSNLERLTNPIGRALKLAKKAKIKFVAFITNLTARFDLFVTNQISQFETFTTNWTTRMTTSNPVYYVAVYLNGCFDKMCGYNLTTSVSATNDTLSCTDVVVELENGYLSWVLDEDLFKTYGLDNLESLVEFGLSMEEEGRNFLYVALPEKIELSDYSGTISEVYEDYYYLMTQTALETVSAAGLDSLCMLQKMEEDGMDSVTSFYETDTHWRATTGLYACGVLGEALNELYCYKIDNTIFDEENYTITFLEDQWLGYFGRKATPIYCDLEDFEIIMPNYKTDLTVYRSNTNAIYSGTIDETLFNWGYLSGNYNVLSYYPYAFYGYGDLAYISIHNNYMDDGSNVLIIKTSFADCVAPFFAQSVENLYILDLRYFTGCVRDFINDIDPDTVVIMYDTYAYTMENTWTHTNLFDFR